MTETETEAPCASLDCEELDLRPIPHLRVQISPPGIAWQRLRFCDIDCLADWLDGEFEAPTLAWEGAG